MTPKELEDMIMRGKNELYTANKELARIGFEYARIRGEYKKEFSKKCYIYLMENKTPSSKAEIMANNDLSDLVEMYERLKVEFETQTRLCKHIADQINASQTLLRSLRHEWGTE